MLTSSLASQCDGSHSTECGGDSISGVTTMAWCANQPTPSAFRMSRNAYIADRACSIGGLESLCQSPCRSMVYQTPSCLLTPPPLTSATTTTPFQRMTKSDSACCLYA